MGLTMSPDALPEGIEVEPGWIAYRYDDCSRILRDAKTFTSTGYDVTIGMVMGHMILGMDDPEHRSHRNLVAHAFREKALARWEPEFIRPIIDEQIDRFAADGEADLVRQLTFEFPVRVIARLLGLPEEDFPQFQRWSVELIGLVADIDRGLAASEALREYFAGVVAERRAHPAEDVISDLVSAEVDGEKLTDEAIYSFLRLLLPAGAETTYRSSGNLLYLLLTHPDQLEAVRADRSLLPQAIEEGLRYEPPLLDDQPDHDVRGRDRRRHLGPGESITPAHRLRQPRRDALGRPRVVRHLPARRAPHRVRARPAHVPRHAPGPARDARPAQPRVRPPAGPDPPARATGDPHIRGDVFRSPTSLPVTFTPGGVSRGARSADLAHLHLVAPGDEHGRHHGGREQAVGDDAGRRIEPRRPARRDRPRRRGSRPGRPRRASGGASRSTASGSSRRVAARPKARSSSGTGACSRATGLSEDTMTTKRSAAAATIRSRVWAPPPPLIEPAVRDPPDRRRRWPCRAGRRR